MPTLCVGGVKLRGQLNKKFPNRDKRSDGWIADAAHSLRASDHNYDSRGIVHAIDVDENFGKLPGGGSCRIFADELLAYAASGLPGSNRVKNVVYENQVASGTYKKSWWKFRGSKYGHEHHVHISFTAAADTDGSVWPLPSLAMTLAQEKSWRSKLGGVK